MLHLSAFATVALSFAVSVSSLAIPRATPPPGWNTPLLEAYDTYHTRYMAISCETKHNTPFFDQCCHPLLATETLATARPALCNVSTSSTVAAAPASSTSTDDGDDDDDLPFCDDDDGDDDSTTIVAATPAAVTTHPAAVTTPPPAVTTPAAKKVTTTTTAKPVATPSTNSGSSSVNTGGFATFFYQNGVAGACGTVHKDTDLIAAIDGDRYGNLGERSSLCGKQVSITNTKNNKSVTVTIADACPTCDNGNSIDLSTAAFQKIATLDEGLVPITWEFI